ncbi:hypothetical protein GCM10022209_06850 [Chitinophaga oryziterrae]
MPGMDNTSGNEMPTDTSTSETHWNTLPTNRIVIARQKLTQPVFAETDFTITGNGYIAFDTRRDRKVSVRVAGRIEQLYVKYNYQHVHKGEKMLELYSPELNTYIEEYLYVRQKTNDTVLQRKAEEKLLLLGLTRAQVQQIGKIGNSPFSIPIYSPVDGYVLVNSSPAPIMGNTGNSSGSMGSGMSNAGNSPTAIQGSLLTDNSIREGIYVSKDQTLFRINDFKEAWGIIAFNKESEKYLYKGQSVTISSELLPGKPIQTTIQLIEQLYQDGQKFTQARVYISNKSGNLKQNSLIDATISVPVKSMTVPAGSVYYLGEVAIVWVEVGITREGSHIFQPKVVKTGYRSMNKVEILNGVTQNDRIAMDAAYLTDGEAIIKY